MADYSERCRDLKRKLQVTQEQNEVIFSMIERTKKMIQRARLERSVLLDKLDRVSKNPSAGEDEQEENTPPNSPGGPVENGKEGTSAGEAANNSGGATTIKRTGGNKLPNAYTVFCDEERDNVIKALEGTGVTIKPSLIQTNLSDRWKALSKEQKKPYSERARELKKRGTPYQSEDTEDESMRDQKEDTQFKDEMEEDLPESQDYNIAMSEPQSELASEPASEPPMDEEDDE